LTIGQTILLNFWKCLGLQVGSFQQELAMSDFSGKRVLVVGATGAFGREFCDRLMQLGALVLGTASSAESSARLRPDLEQRLLLNLESLDSINELTSYLTASGLALDGIILASGLVAFGSLTETPPAVSSRLMQVNALGQMHLVQALVPTLKISSEQSRNPFVLSISGVISEQPMAGLAAYSASKTALHGFSIAAGREFGKIGIGWLDARPGHTESGLAGRAILGSAPNFGAGKSVEVVVNRMVQAILDGEKDLPSSSFQ
jgi:NAD(P)-dependent dehydrogenase (short-subunit alcohol dehydrogenase family)